ncbi:DUF4190 domain-containing protein [Micromonospora purpureochromogenes]|uniref:DUF4190 domain-containing protein n=1 Tax=Micromonospora purpureochromogenes TaxID=47872 RepID=UPI00362A81F0
MSHPPPGEPEQPPSPYEQPGQPSGLPQWGQQPEQQQWGQQPEQQQWGQQPERQQWGQQPDQPQWGQQPEQPQWGQPQEHQQWAQQPAYPPQGPYGQYGPPPGGGGPNTMAILSLVFAFVFAPAGIVLGHLAKRQIRRTGEDGDQLATWGLILSYVFTAIGLLVCCGWIGLAIWANSDGGGTYN